MIIILNNIRSAANVGTILRTADALGAQEVALCGYTPAPVDDIGRPCSQLLKASLGAEKSVAWKQYTTLEEAIQVYKKTNECICLEQTKGAVVYNTYTPKGDIALVVGNEVDGLSEKECSLCDSSVYIPMRGKKESLNVAVALGIVAYHFTM